MTKPRQAIIALGSNLGDRSATLSRALALLADSPDIGQVTPSSIYETAPVGVEDQPAFLNLVAGVHTRLSPEALLTLLLDVEQQLGRVRTLRWGPRTIDLDLLFFENEERQTPALTLPHPRWAERSFVTIPLHELLQSSAFDSPSWSWLREKLHNLPPDPDVRKIRSVDT